MWWDNTVREIAFVYSDGINFNKVLMENNLSRICNKNCDISEFKNEKWGNRSVNLSKRFGHVYKGGFSVKCSSS
jgi:hypothetical protein